MIVNLQTEYNDPDAWKMWLRETRKALPEPWPEKGSGRLAADGSEHFGQFRLLAWDQLEQSHVREVRLEKWVEGKLVKTEEYTLRGNMYFKNELFLMLKAAGFRELTVQGDYTDQPATGDHGELVFTAIKLRPV